MTASELRPSGPLDRLLDLVVYAPLGLALRAREEIPKLADTGRRQFDRQANVARMVGQMAVAQGRRQVGTWLERLSGRPAQEAAPVPAPAEPPGRAVLVRDLERDDSPPAPVPLGETLPVPAPATEVTAAPDAADLPIPGYDSLSASQVVELLAGLSRDELEAVRAYEQAGRGRKTVLLRVAQLRSAG